MNLAEVRLPNRGRRFEYFSDSWLALCSDLTKRRRASSKPRQQLLPITCVNLRAACGRPPEKRLADPARQLSLRRRCGASEESCVSYRRVTVKSNRLTVASTEIRRARAFEAKRARSFDPVKLLFVYRKGVAIDFLFFVKNNAVLIVVNVGICRGFYDKPHSGI